MTVYIPVGISGAGKSTYYTKNFSKIKNICLDDIRKKLTGDISDQSMNIDVFEQAYNTLANYAFKGKDVYFSATNLSRKAIQQIYDVVTLNAKDKKNLNFVILLFKDSYDEELCRSRVKSDLESGIDRANTLVNVDDGEGNILDYDVIHKQYESFLEIVKDVFLWRSEVVENDESGLINISIKEV